VPTVAHPRSEELDAFAQGKLSPEQFAVIEEHVLACDACAAALESQPEDALLRAARAAASPEVPPFSTACAATAANAPDSSLPAAADAEVSAAVLAELSRHERYRVVRPLGRGGMGVVYQAEHRVMQRSVALKVINRRYTADAAAAERFRREVRAAARLHHPNIVTAFDADNVGDAHFLIMEYVEGRSLARVLEEHGPLPVAAACDHVRQAALGLQHAHERGMVHRDVKPDNLMLTPDGTVKVLDFGLAALTAERGPGGLTEVNVLMGTPAYMAPEQAEDARQADTRADVYSLGCTLYHLLTGSVPYPAPTALLKILAHREQPLPPLRAVRPEVPEGLEAVLARLLAKKPQDRYQTPGEVAAALAPFTQPVSVRPKKRRPWLIAALVALLLAGGGVAAALYHIQTDKGELVITAESDDVEVVVKQGGKVIRLVDTKTDKQITLTLRSGAYELELKGAPEGLKLSLDKATLSRGETVLARIERVAAPAGKQEPSRWTVTGLPDKPGRLCTVPWASARRDQSSVQLAQDGRLIAVAADQEPGDSHFIRVYETATGRLVREVDHPFENALSWVFLPDGKHLLTVSVPNAARRSRVVRIRDLGTGSERRLRDVETALECWPPFALSGDGHRLCLAGGTSEGGVFDLETESVLLHFRLPTPGPRGTVEQLVALSDDGKWLAVSDTRRDREDAPYNKGQLFVHDVEGKRPARQIDAADCVGTPFFPAGGGQVGALRHSPEDGYWVEYWDLASGRSVRRVRLAAKTLEPFQTPVGPLVSGSDGDGRALFFDTATGKVVFRSEPVGVAMSKVSADGRVAAVLTNPLRLYRLPAVQARAQP
jgi:tRNA A-37 threonylcarbamoyl transferase component Bud32